MSSHLGSVIDRSRIKLWDDTGHEHDMMSTRVLGFWLYMLSDSLIFAALFAAYDVLTYNTGMVGSSMSSGPTARDVASPIYAYVESFVLLTSVLFYGIAMVEIKRGRPWPVLGWIGAALVVGIGFLGLEWHELAGLAAQGDTPQRSGFLSIFFTIVAVHGVHIAFGLLWMFVMLAQVVTKGLTIEVVYRLVNLKVFWLYQALIWTFLDAFVYLRGSI